MAVISMDEIRRFFDKMTDELNERLDSLTIEGNELDISIKENSRFLEVLSKESEVPFSEFSPRDLSYKNEKKINELKEMLDSQKKDKDNIDKEINDIKNRLNEIKTLIESSSNVDDSSSKETGSDLSEMEMNSGSTNNQNNSYKDIKPLLENIDSYLPADPMRAKIELKNIINKL